MVHKTASEPKPVIIYGRHTFQLLDFKPATESIGLCYGNGFRYTKLKRIENMKEKYRSVAEEVKMEDYEGKIAKR